jgi:hypothetical protein
MEPFKNPKKRCFGFSAKKLFFKSILSHPTHLHVANAFSTDDDDAF